MKTLTTALLALALSNVLVAQFDYQLFRPDVQYLYSSPFQDEEYASPVLGMRLSADPCGYTYESALPIPNESAPWELSYHLVPAFAGRYVCQTEMATQLNIGTEEHPHLLAIQPSSALGETWLVTDAPYSVYGRIDSVVWENTLGLWDSIKYIGLYRLDAAEDWVPLYADTPIKVSKQYGLVRGVFFHALGQDLGTIDLIGLSTPTVGMQHPTRATIFQAQVGDAYHVRNFNTISASDTWAHQTRLQRAILIAQYWSAANDTLYYVFESEQQTFSEGPGSDGLVTYQLSVRDTFGFVWNELAYLDAQPGTLVPEGSAWGDYYYVVTVNAVPFCGAYAKQHGRLLGRLEAADTSLVAFIDAAMGDLFYERFAGPFRLNFGIFGYNLRELKYLRRAEDGSTCGEPFDFIVNVANEQMPAIALHLWPQPTSDRLYVHWADDVADWLDMELLDANGRHVGTFSGMTPGSSIEMGALPAGLYTLRVRNVRGAWQTFAVVKM